MSSVCCLVPPPTGQEVKPKQLCLVAFLPHILDSKAAGREAYLQASRTSRSVLRCAALCCAVLRCAALCCAAQCWLTCTPCSRARPLGCLRAACH